jgi:YidC/Oxa1 family membrane protein insertase
MPDLLFPIKWIIELILVSFHSLFTFLGLPAASGLSWVLAIIGSGFGGPGSPYPTIC